MCVGRSESCLKPKLSSDEEKSMVRVRAVLSICISKSTSSITLGERVERWVRRAENLFKKSL